MSTQIEGTPVKGMPPELADKGWQLFLNDNMRFRVGNSEHDLLSGPYPTADEAISDARDRQVELDEADAIREEAREAEIRSQESEVSTQTEPDASAKVPELPLDEPPPRLNFDPYTTILAVHTVDPEVALSMRAEGLNMLKVAEYAEAMLGGAQFPAADVFFDGKVYHLAGGAHRHRSTTDAKLTEFLVTVHAGTKRDALIWAASENRTHGLARTNADKRLAVETCLRDEEWVIEADSVIAAHTGTSQPFVGSVRETLETQNVISPQPKRRGKDRVVRDTSNIGARDEVETADDRQSTLADIGVDLPEKPTDGGPETAVRTCRLCHCTDNNACEGGCTWVEDDLCSKCQYMPAAGAEQPGSDEPYQEKTSRPDWEQGPDEIVACLNRHSGVLMRMQLEEMGFSHAAILNAVGTGAIAQPEIGKFTLPDHKPQPPSEEEAGGRRQEAAADSRQPASSPPSKPKQRIEELLKGRMLTVSFTWIPKVPGVSVSVKAGKPEDAERGMITGDDVPRLPESVLAMIARQLKGEKPAAARTGGSKAVSSKKPAKRSAVRGKPAKRSAVRGKPAVRNHGLKTAKSTKKKPTPKKKAAKGRKR